MTSQCPFFLPQRDETQSDTLYVSVPLFYKQFVIWRETDYSTCFQKRYNFYIFHMPGILSQSFLPPNGFLVVTNILIILTFFSFFFISFQSCLFSTEKKVKDCLKWSIFFLTLKKLKKKYPNSFLLFEKLEADWNRKVSPPTLIEYKNLSANYNK